MDLFENEKGWIITKNQKGKVRLAACSEDESNISETSREWVEIAVDKTKLNTFKPRQGNSIATLFIRDYLNSERKDSYFETKTAKLDILYRKVFICGTVVELNTRTAKHSIVGSYSVITIDHISSMCRRKRKNETYARTSVLMSQVDDGTSCIKCIMPTEMNLPHIKSTASNVDDSCEEEGTPQSNGVSDIIFSKVEDLKKCIPELKQLNLGDIVKLVGGMSEYNGLRYVFINSIAKEPKRSTFYSNHMEYLLKLYSKLFDI